MPRERVLIWGSGGHGRVVADLVRACGAEVAGFIDRDREKLGKVVEPGGAKVVVVEDEFRERWLITSELPAGACSVMPAIGSNEARVRTLTQLGEYLTPALVHPKAYVSRSAILSRGTVVLAGAVVNAQAGVGRAGIVNSGAVVEHDCDLAEAVHVSPGAVITGGVSVGAGAWIGAGAVVREGLRIGRDSIVGAGAVVLRDVEDGWTVVGNPARRIR
jgi:UDP-perosamine 4-acetyltransferase